MAIADEHIAAFQKLYQEHFGIELTKAQALEKGLRLIRLFETVSRGVADEQQPPKNNYEQQ
jgi:hypothetical protein